MEKNTSYIIIGLLVFIIGFGAGYLSRGGQIAPDEHTTSGGMMMRGERDMQGMMDAMMMTLSGKTGDAFDEAFLSEMIMHHEGAVGMAEAALRDAKHDEIKQLAQAIIAAQTEEISQMKEWKRSWYGQ